MAADDNSLEGLTPEEAQSLGVLYQKLARDPATRDTVLRATKKVAPETSIPEIEILDRVALATKPLQDELQKMTTKEMEREMKQRLRDARDALKEAGHSADEIADIEKFMLDKHKEGTTLQHKDAADFWKLQKQTAQPHPSNTRINTLPVSGKELKEAGGIRKFANAEAHKAIDDVRAGRIRLH